MMNCESESGVNDRNKATKDFLIKECVKVNAYHVYVITWNIGTRFPDNISLRNLFDLNNEHSDRLPDIYAIGLQEVNVQPQQQVMSLFKEDSWTLKAKNLLSGFDYVLIKTKQLQGILLMIFVKRIHLVHLREIDSECTRTGFGGMWGNKGAVSVRFSLYGCAIVFINAHLAAHDHQIKERIVDFKQIIENQRFHVKKYHHIIDHDYVFWFGDLNFRLNGDDTAFDLEKVIRNTKDFNNLIKRDQLRYVREETKEAFNMFQECRPNFPPTFKFKEGTSQYDLKRRPAWTDRILYAIRPRYSNSEDINQQLEIIQKYYHSHSEYSISDHKPVSCVFTIKLNSHFKVSSIEFHPIDVWLIGKENMIEYRRPLEFEEYLHDWIGIFEFNFSSLNDYVAYEYISQKNSSLNKHNMNNDTFLEYSPQQGHRNQLRQLDRQQHSTVEIIRLEFTNEIDLKDGIQYVLIYIQCDSIQGITSVAGISDVFYARINPTRC